MGPAPLGGSNAHSSQRPTLSQARQASREEEGGTPQCPCSPYPGTREGFALRLASQMQLALLITMADIAQALASSLELKGEPMCPYKME